MAARVRSESSDERGAVETLFLLTTGRKPTAGERVAAETFLHEQPSHYTRRPDASDAAWVDLCQMVLSTSAFLYVE
jgi:hypothetical protein